MESVFANSCDCAGNFLEINVPLDFSKKYDLVFVDQAPWSARIDTIDFLTDKNTSVFILHDYDQYNINEYEDKTVGVQTLACVAGACEI